MTLKLTGPVPSKKNGYRRSANGRMHIPAETKAAIEALTLQARMAWGKRMPVRWPKIEAKFYVKDGRSDLDNKWTTISDVLVKAGVLVNDSIASCPGPISMVAEVVKGQEEWTEIKLS